MTGVMMPCISCNFALTWSYQEMGIVRAFRRANGTASGFSWMDIGGPVMIFSRAALSMVGGLGPAVGGGLRSAPPPKQKQICLKKACF